MAKEKITFLASLPPIQSAIMVDGTGDSMTVKLQIPIKQYPQALQLNLMTQKVLKVTITEEPQKKPAPAPKPADKKKDARHWTPRQKKQKAISQ